jgi:hypothetical protein
MCAGPGRAINPPSQVGRKMFSGSGHAPLWRCCVPPVTIFPRCERLPCQRPSHTSRPSPPCQCTRPREVGSSPGAAVTGLASALLTNNPAGLFSQLALPCLGLDTSGVATTGSGLFLCDLDMVVATEQDEPGSDPSIKQSFFSPDTPLEPDALGYSWPRAESRWWSCGS